LFSSLPLSRKSSIGVDGMHLVQFHGAFYDRGEILGKRIEMPSVCMIIDYVSGGSLDDAIQSSGAMTEEECVKLAQEMLEALRYMHRNGFIHRDVKPSNILIDGEDFVLCDFGISLRIQDLVSVPTPAPLVSNSSDELKSGMDSLKSSCDQLMSPLSLKKTASGILRRASSCGTQLFMSPATLMGHHHADVMTDFEELAKMDVWSLGIVVFYALTGGSYPFDNNGGLFGMCASLKEFDFARDVYGVLESKGLSLSPSLYAFLEKCICVDSRVRSSVDELLHDPIFGEDNSSGLRSPHQR